MAGGNNVVLVAVADHDRFVWFDPYAGDDLGVVCWMRLGEVHVVAVGNERIVALQPGPGEPLPDGGFGVHGIGGDDDSQTLFADILDDFSRQRDTRNTVP